MGMQASARIAVTRALMPSRQLYPHRSMNIPCLAPPARPPARRVWLASLLVAFVAQLIPGRTAGDTGSSLPAVQLSPALVSTAAGKPDTTRVPVRGAARPAVHAGGLRFASNAGQWPGDISFRTVGLRHGISIGREGILIATGGSTELRMTVVGGASPLPGANGLRPARARANFHRGARESHRVDVAVFERVVLPEVYPGIDLVFYGTADGKLEYDFELAPGADPSVIGIRFDYRADGQAWTPCAPRLPADGNLEIPAGPNHAVVFKAPRTFQQIAGNSKLIDSRFIINTGGSVSFAVGDYDCALPLRIDPELLYTVLLSPSDASSTYEADDVAIDSQGNAWIAGQVNGTGFPVTPDAENGTGVGLGDLGLLKLDPAGELLYATYFGGGGHPTAVVVANDDSVWIAGYTLSADFPVAGAATQGAHGGLDDGFLARFDASGQLVYSTYLGGARWDRVQGLAIDRSNGAIWVCGTTASLNFPVAGGPVQPAIAHEGLPGSLPPHDAFIAKFSSGGALLYSTYLGSGEHDGANGIDIDSFGNAWVCGDMSSIEGWPPEFPVTPDARQPDRHVDTIDEEGSQDAFLVKFAPTGGLLYASYISGTGDDHASDVVVTSADEVWVLGETTSDDLEVTGDALKPALQGLVEDIFLHRYDNSGRALLHGSYFGGSRMESLARGAVDSDDNLWITGITWSDADFPVDSTAAQPFSGSNAGGDEDGQDAFIAGFSLGGAQFSYCSYLGGSRDEYAGGIAIDGSNVAWIVGTTGSLDFPIAGNQPAGPPWTGSSESAWFISRFGLGQPPLGLSLQPRPGDPGIGETVTLHAKVFNNLKSNISAVEPAWELEFSGSGEVELVSGPTPVSVPLIAPGDFVEFEWELKAVKRGDVTIAVQMVGFDVSGDPVYSGRRSCAPIRIGSRGDLKIRAASEGELSYAINDIYQTAPAGAQIERVSTHPEGAAVFKVLVENDAPADSSSGTTAFVLQSEGAPDGWTLAASREAVEISAAITGPGGWETPRLQPGESVEITVTLTPDPGIAKGVEKSVRLTLRSTDESLEVLDSVEARALVEDAFMTVDPPEALLGEKVAVVLHFFNDSTTAMTLVTPALGALPAPLGDAEVSEPQPASVPVLQPGQEAVFTYEVKGIAKGEATLLGQISYHQNGGGPFFTSMIQKNLKIDRIEVVEIEPVQAIPDVPMISGKPAVALLTAHNPLSIPKQVALKLTVKQPGAPDQVFNVSPTLNPGEQKEFIPKEGSFSITAPGELKIEIEPDNPDVHDYPGRQLTSEFDTVETHQLNYVFCRPVVAARYALPAVDPAAFQAIADVNSAYLDATYPMIPLGAPSLDVLQIDWTSRPVTPASIWSAAERKAIRDGLDRIVLVLPPHPAMIDATPGEMEGLLGYTYGGKVVIFIDHSQDERPENAAAYEPSANTVAHEIGHTFGFPDSLQIADPDVPLGIWVERNESVEDHFNFMAYRRQTWVNKAHYEALIASLSSPIIDPVVMLLSGSITPGGQVTADPWSTMTTDQVSVPNPAGSYVFEFLDSGGAILRRFRFGVEFQLTEATVSPAGQVGSVTVQLQEVPFSFSIVRPAGLAKVLLRGPANQLLFSRDVTANPPVVTSLSINPAGPYTPGQQRTVSWTASDPDGDPLTFALLYSEDGGASWKLDCEFLEGNQCTWTVPDAATARGMLKVEASDGVNSGERQSAAFQISDNRPRLIVNPGMKLVTQSGIPVSLNGSASHSSDGRPVSFVWSLTGQPANGNGILTNATSGTAGFLATTPGLYVVRLTVRTPAPRALSASAFTTVYVEADELPDLTITTQDAGGRSALSWPLSSPGAALQMSDDLQLWRPVAEIPGQTAESYRLLIDPTEAERQYYRLHRPAANP
jgi:hypothetical protein